MKHLSYLTLDNGGNLDYAKFLPINGESIAQSLAKLKEWANDPDSDCSPVVAYAAESNGNYYGMIGNREIVIEKTGNNSYEGWFKDDCSIEYMGNDYEVFTEMYFDA